MFIRIFTSIVIIILAFSPLSLYGFLDSVKETLQDLNEIHRSLKDTHREVKDTAREVQQTTDEVQGESEDVPQADIAGNENLSPDNSALPSVEFYIAINNVQEGPYDTSALKQKIVNKEMDKNTLVWKEGMNKWTKAGEVPELISIFDACPPPLPPPLPPQLPQE